MYIYKHIVLSFAPSAATVGHCDIVRITCESNPVRHFQDSLFLPQEGPPQGNRQGNIIAL